MMNPDDALLQLAPEPGLCFVGNISLIIANGPLRKKIPASAEVFGLSYAVFWGAFLGVKLSWKIFKNVFKSKSSEE